MRIEAGWNQFDTKSYNNHSNTIRSLSVTGNLIAELPLKTFVRAYVIGGAGYYGVQHALGTTKTYTSGVPAVIDSTVIVLGTGGTLNKLGANLGGGLRLPLWKVETYVEARVNKVAGGYGIRFIPITFGLRF